MLRNLWRVHAGLTSRPPRGDCSNQLSPETISSRPSLLMSATVTDSQGPRSRVCFSKGISSDATRGVTVSAKNMRHGMFRRIRFITPYPGGASLLIPLRLRVSLRFQKRFTQRRQARKGVVARRAPADCSAGRSLPRASRGPARSRLIEPRYSWEIPISRASPLIKPNPRRARSSPVGARSRQMAAAAAKSGSGCANDSIVSQPL